MNSDDLGWRDSVEEWDGQARQMELLGICYGWNEAIDELLDFSLGFGDVPYSDCTVSSTSGL